jgi:hypothetical protein
MIDDFTMGSLFGMVAMMIYDRVIWPMIMRMLW